MTSRHWLDKFWGRASRRPTRTRKAARTRTRLGIEDLEARTLLTGSWAGNGEWPGAARRLRFDRTLGFWLGAAVLGTAGCIVGASMPYRHPVAVTANLLWWGLFLGCLGGSLGSLLGLGAEQTRGS
jgi:hypothetical protein